MAYKSIDKLQNALGEQVFHYTQDRKKVAGRALGTIVEIINLYSFTTLLIFFRDIFGMKP